VLCVMCVFNAGADIRDYKYLRFKLLLRGRTLSTNCFAIK